MQSGLLSFRRESFKAFCHENGLFSCKQKHAENSSRFFTAIPLVGFAIKQASTKKLVEIFNKPKPAAVASVKFPLDMGSRHLLTTFHPNSEPDQEPHLQNSSP